MNILMCTNTYLPHVGGVARSVAAFSEEFRRAGHRALIVAPEFEGQPAEETDVIRIPAIQNFNGSDFSVRLPAPGILSAALADFRPHIVHAHHPFLLGDTAARVAAESGVPLVFTHHTMYEQYTHYVPGDAAVLGKFVQELTTSYTHLCDAVIAPSESVAAILRERGVVAPIRVVPTGVDVPRFESGDGASIRAELGIPPGAFVVGHLGRLAPEKNLPFLADAVARFLKRRKDAHFLIAGSGPSEGAIRDLFRTPALRERLHFAGPRSGQQLVNAYHAMDVFAFASLSETQGMVLTEAMAAGVPVVAIDAPGAREVVVDQSNGRLLSTADERLFAAALKWVADQGPERRERLRHGARRTAAEFALPRTAQQALDLYGELRSTAARDRTNDVSTWEAALRRVEVEWNLWSGAIQAAQATLEAPQIGRVPVIGTALHGWRIMRRWFSRTEWGARLLRLPRRPPSSERGLILVQIDGLSRNQMEHALRRRRLPFLQRLLVREGYELHTHYSGIPSTTAAVQGELFYGVRTAVPAFAFGRREAGQVATMLDPQIAAHVQTELARGRVGLLAGGFAFCNPYTGGAAEAHCCASALGWSDLLRYANPLGIALVLASYGGKVLRAIGLSLLELGLALFDCVRGVTTPRDALRELKFIPSRVGVCVFLRELSAVGASMAAARGVPVIQLNFLGYDEQAHQRGPGSTYAHWSLKAIDQAIRQVWNAAHQATGREYSIWIYSDHGQQKVTPYEDVAGRTIQDAVTEVFRPFWQARSLDERGLAGRPMHRHSARSRYLRRGAPPPPLVEDTSNEKPDQVLVAAVGPLGHLYLPVPLPWEDLRAACRKLATDAGVPLVMVPRDEQSAVAWTSQGEFELPRDAARLLGDDHPFLAEAAADLTRLCQHPQAGDIVIAGWRAGAKPLSFVSEFGAHGGVSPEETRGFALLPADTRFPESEHDHLRPADLRAAALHVLGRADHPPRRSRRRQRETLRIATYNVHSCLGMDGRLSASRIARVLAHCDADVIALQEIDVRRRRSQFRDQAREIARELQMQFHFHPALSLAEERYGDAVLSRRPMRLIRADQLPGVDSPESVEPRGALWVAVDLGDRELQLINTHLGLLPHERMRQVRTLLGEDWVGHPDCRDPLVLCGDLNLRPDTPAYAQLATRLRDAQRSLNGHRPKKTWFSHFPLARIDHVFVGAGVQVVHVDVPRSRLARVASDHLPLIVDLQLT